MGEEQVEREEIWVDSDERPLEEGWYYSDEYNPTYLEKNENGVWQVYVSTKEGIKRGELKRPYAAFCLKRIEPKKLPEFLGSLEDRAEKAMIRAKWMRKKIRELEQAASTEV